MGTSGGKALTLRAIVQRASCSLRAFRELLKRSESSDKREQAARQAYDASVDPQLPAIPAFLIPSLPFVAAILPAQTASLPRVMPR